MSSPGAVSALTGGGTLGSSGSTLSPLMSGQENGNPSQENTSISNTGNPSSFSQTNNNNNNISNNNNNNPGSSIVTPQAASALTQTGLNPISGFENPSLLGVQGANTGGFPVSSNSQTLAGGGGGNIIGSGGGESGQQLGGSPTPTQNTPTPTQEAITWVTVTPTVTVVPVSAMGSEGGIASSGVGGGSRVGVALVVGWMSVVLGLLVLT